MEDQIIRTANYFFDSAKESGFISNGDIEDFKSGEAITFIKTQPMEINRIVEFIIDEFGVQIFGKFKPDIININFTINWADCDLEMLAIPWTIIDQL